MMSKSVDTEEETPEPDEELEENDEFDDEDDDEEEPVYKLDVEEIVKIRQYCYESAAEYWGTRVQFDLDSEMEPEKMTRYPMHISTIIDTALHIEKFLTGDFDRVVNSE